MMTIEQEIHSDLPVPPGCYMTEIIKDMRMSQAELERRMDQPVQTVRGIARGTKAVTADVALRLERVLGVPAHIWTGMEAEYQLTKTRNEAAEQIKEESKLVARFPYSAIAKCDWVEPTRKRTEKVVELRRFFGVSSLSRLHDVRAYAPAFRQSVRSGAGVSRESLAVWLRVAPWRLRRSPPARSTPSARARRCEFSAFQPGRDPRPFSRRLRSVWRMSASRLC